MTQSVRRGREINSGRWSLTSYERTALETSFNLADGHAQHDLPSGVAELLPSVSQFLQTGIITNYPALEDDVTRGFFSLAGQTPIPKHVLYFHSASQAIEAAANVLKALNRHLFLVEPTFDNIADIICRNLEPAGYLEGIDRATADSYQFSRAPLISLPDPDAYAKLAFDPPFGENKPRAIFLVVPNNPDGTELNEQTFGALCQRCARDDVILICDFCFRFYSRAMGSWNQYEIARKSGVSYLFIEDTGKTFPLKDIKTGILVASEDLAPLCRRIHFDFILTVTPLIMETLKIVINEALSLGVATFLDDISHNRLLLRSATDSFGFELPNPQSTLPFEWLKEGGSNVSGWGRSSLEFFNAAQQTGVMLLPGGPFFWSNPASGLPYLRVSLARPKPYFTAALDRLKKMSRAHSFQDHPSEVGVTVPPGSSVPNLR